MADEDQSDPFLWDEDRVVQELCTENPTWMALAKRPDPAALEAALRDYGVDGESLLTYGDEFGFDKLCSYLGVKKFPHQQSLNNAISRLQKRSPRYSEWKAARLADSQPQAVEENADQVVKSESHPPAEPETTGQASLLPGQGVLSPALSPSADPDTLAPPEIPASGLDEDVQEGPPNKKRRIAPTAIADAPTGNSAFAVIPTEGDIFLAGGTAAETVLQSDDSSGFLGPEILRRDQLTDSSNPGEPSTAPSGFSFVQQRIPPGRRIQVSAAMKKFLRSDHLARLDGGLEDEVTLPRFGDSDDDDEGVDSETWREYQEEEAERERLACEAREQANKDRLLSKEEVTNAVAVCIQDLEGQWLAEKKPSLDLKAWRMWQDARRNPDRLALIDSAKRQLHHCSARITRYEQHIINQPWSVKDDIQQKASGHLEVSVFEQKRQAWLIDILESPRQPTKPSNLPRPTPRPVKPAMLDDGEEDLASETDDMDAFIEYDDVQQPLPFFGDEMEVDSAPPPAQPAAPASPSRDSLSIHGGEADASSLPAIEGSPSGQQSSDDAPPVHPTPKEIKAEKAPAPATPRRAVAAAPQVIELDSSPSPVQTPDQIPELDGLESFRKIGEIGTRYWETIKDAERLVIAVLCSWSHDTIASLNLALENLDDDQSWDQYMLPTIEDPASATVGSVAFFLCRLFDVFLSKSATRASGTTLKRLTCQRMHRQGHLFPSFCGFLRRMLPLFLGLTPRQRSPTAAEAPQPSDIRDPAEEQGTSEEELSSGEMPEPSTKKRRRRKRLDRNAANIRIDNLRLNEELARRSQQLREKIAQQGSVSSKQSRLIVNETKESDEDALIYINDHIGSRIKDHQIEGVRFMWNQVVVDSRVRQGCLLAHTMGLGKTMQVITLLVVIAESSASPDSSVRSQIPESLRETKTLILCPASLVDNWHEEIRMWAPDEVLGVTRRIHSTLLPPERVAAIKDWALTGGVLIIGYTLFSGLVHDNDEIATLLYETPSLVVGDEAHALKNPKAQRTQAAANFKTMSRIAMTGSPLTKNVMDYYSMINWVAPNYLADIAEFKQRFSNPINEGLWADSDPYQKRKARKMLQVLKATVDPKVHRRDIEVLRSELPRKKEFILTLPLTKLQKRLYQAYIRAVTDPGKGMITSQTNAWSLVARLGLVLAHPFIFKTVAEAQKAKPKGKKPRPSSTGEQKSEEADAVELPQDVLHDLLATVAVREIEDYALSWKIRVLLCILDECRNVRDKVLVFSQSLPTLNYIESICKRQRVVYQRLDGNTPVPTRQDAIKKFNTAADSEVYLVTTTAGGVGLNIQGANRVVIFDFKYTPAEEQQAIGRAYRLGQTKPVYVYWLTLGGTFEDTIHNNAVFKTQLASRVVDKKNPDPRSTRFSEYFAMPREVEQEDLSGAKGQDQVLDALLACDDISKHIRKITSTETFETEETYELTAEEKREVEDDVKLELLRSQDPEAFKRRERERFLQQQQQQQQQQPRYGYGMPFPPSSVYQPQPHPHPYPQPQPQPRPADALVHHPPDPFAPVPSSFVAPPPAQAPLSQNYPKIGLTYHQSAPNSAVDAAPQPILAPGTHYKPVATPSLPPLRSGPPAVGGSSTTSAPLSMAAEIATFDFPYLPSVHSALCREGRHVRHHPGDLIARIKEQLARNKFERLPMMDKLQNMEKFSRNPRFAEAMLSGHLEPEQLATMTRIEMEEISASLGGMAEGEFKQRVWTTKANLNQLREYLSTRAQAERRHTGVPAGEARQRVNRGVMLRLIGAGSEPPDPATPQDRRRGGVKPGDSAESPHVID